MRTIKHSPVTDNMTVEESIFLAGHGDWKYTPIKPLKEVGDIGRADSGEDLPKQPCYWGGCEITLAVVGIVVVGAALWIELGAFVCGVVGRMGGR